MLGFSPADLSYKVVEGFDYYSEDFVNIGYVLYFLSIINYFFRNYFMVCYGTYYLQQCLVLTMFSNTFFEY